MPANADNARPVIIKRKKVLAGHAHHGGAWKVAYADFVTAMMAFFMLMWLLNATTERQRKGLADYFSPNVPIVRISGGGEGAFGGDSMLSEQTQAQNGTGASGERPTDAGQAAGLQGGEELSPRAEADAGAVPEAEGGLGPEAGEGTPDAAEAQNAEAGLRGIGQALAGLGGDSRLEDLSLDHVQTRLTDEGLVIEVFSLPGQPLFRSGAEPAAILREVTGVIAPLFRAVENPVAIEAHLSAPPLARADQDGWTLSTRRADRVRTLLQQAGLPAARMARVTGHSDRRPRTDDPLSARNDRVEIILIRSDLARP